MLSRRSECWTEAVPPCPIFGQGRRPLGILSSLILGLLLLLISGGTSEANSGPATYVYDDLGRLTAVVDGTGNAATYQYDSVGNLLSISRPTSPVSVFGLAPDNGPTGTSVTIYGDGFSTTPSQNSVSFNGAAAAISASSLTALSVTVPSGASSGTVTVISPAGSATGTFTLTR